jgi:signal transduction histidine kinase
MANKTRNDQGGFMGFRRRHLFNIYLLLGSISIVVATTFFTINVSKSVERQSYLTTRLLSDFASRLLQAEDVKEIEPVIAIINEMEVPVILTDTAGRPIMWNEPVIGIPLPPVDMLIEEDPTRPRSPVVADIIQLAADFDSRNEPFAIFDDEGNRLGTLHYGTGALSLRLSIMPYLELMIMALFFLVILWAMQARRQAETTALFAGMAKETAHQLGTPLTSIMGWVALLEEKVDPRDDVLVELNRDVDRLGMISARFSQIGSLPKLEDRDLNAVVDESIEYFQRRLPHLGGRVQIRREGTVGRPVLFNRDLVGWVLENLIKNGIDALNDGKGTITVRLEDGDGGGVRLLVADTGRGVPAGTGNRIFEPGYTTKLRGWGMGLALVKRIVKEYHAGRIRIEETGTGGTTIAVWLPAAPPEEEGAVSGT